MRYQIVGFVLGILIMVQGAAQMIPALLDLSDGHPNASAFFMGGMISVFFGGALMLSCPPDKRGIGVRQAFLLTALSWITVSAFAAIPLCLSDVKASFTDAFFETTSGFTTTGATVFTGLDHMSRGFLLWRAMTTFMGGIGMVGFAVILLPFLRIGGMQLLQAEASDRSDKAMPRIREMSWALMLVFLGLNAACIVAYRTFGMSWFDAICHAFPTIATGGFSTHDLSFAYFDSYAIDMASVVFMISGGVPFVLFVNLLYNGKFDFFRDEQFKGFMALLAVLVGGLTLWLWANSEYDLAQSFRYVAFNITSVITTTGFATTDYLQWGPFATIMFLFITYLGACAGSTAGGIKMMRLIIVSRAVGKQIKMLIYPRGVFAMYYQGKPVSGNVVQTVLGFLCLYVVTNVLLTMALALTGLDFATAISGAAASISNTGPGIGPIIGPVGNFSTLPDIAKWLLSAGMFLGRLEILTFAVLFTPGFWKN